MEIMLHILSSQTGGMFVSIFAKANGWFYVVQSEWQSPVYRILHKEFIEAIGWA